MIDRSPWRWILAAIAVVLIIGLLAYARGRPGAGDRFPSREDVPHVAHVAVAD